MQEPDEELGSSSSFKSKEASQGGRHPHRRGQRNKKHSQKKYDYDQQLYEDLDEDVYQKGTRAIDEVQLFTALS